MDNETGRRIREIRSWRRLSLRAAAQLSGISYSYLAKIERGEMPINSRKVLEALATTLRVAPSELTGSPHTSANRELDAVYAAIPALTDALTSWWVGEVPDGDTRRWPEVRAAVRHVAEKLRPAAAYTELAALLPGLIRDLLIAAESDRQALVGLLSADKAMAYLAHDVGIVGLPSLAVEQMRRVAETLDDPTWITYAAYHRAQLIPANRPRQYQLAVKVAEASGARVETRGMAHLTAAMSCAARGDADTVATHLAEANALAEQLETDVSPWQGTNFGRTNVGIWRPRRVAEGRAACPAESTQQPLRPGSGRRSASTSTAATDQPGVAWACLADGRHPHRVNSAGCVLGGHE